MVKHGHTSAGSLWILALRTAVPSNACLAWLSFRLPGRTIRTNVIPVWVDEGLVHEISLWSGGTILNLLTSQSIHLALLSQDDFHLCNVYCLHYPDSRQ